MPTGQYWKEVFGRAANETWTAVLRHTGVTVLTVCITVTTTAALWAAGSQDAVRDGMIGAAVGLAVTAVFAVCLFVVKLVVIPPEMHQAVENQLASEQKKSALLRKAQKPRIEFDESEMDGQILRPGLKRRESPPFTLALIPIRNAAVSVPVDVRMTLVSYQRRGGPIHAVRAPMVWNAGNIQTAKVNPRSTEHFRLARIAHNHTRVSFLPEGERGEMGGKQDEPAIYRIEVSASSSIGPPVPATYRLIVSIDGRHRLHPWPEDEPWT